MSDALAQGSASPVSSWLGFRPGGTWTGGDWTPGSSLCRESRGQGLYSEPCPPPWERHSPGGEFRGSSCHNLRAPWSGLCVLHVPRVPRTWRAPCALHVCPGRGMHDVFCACAVRSGWRGRCSKTSETEWDFSKPLRKETRREGNYVLLSKALFSPPGAYKGFRGGTTFNK